MENVEQLEQQAIDAAVNNDWKEAININKNIIKIDKVNIDALLRLAFANFQMNKIEEAKKYYKKSLKFQPGNRVAFENLERIKIITAKMSKKHKPSLTLDPNLFLEVPGKTKSVSLVNLGQKNIIAQLSISQEVYLVPKKRRIEIRNKNKDYIGSLPDDISKRLTIFIKAGSEFTAYIKEVLLNKIVVFIREEKKGKKVQKYFSFPSNIQSNLNQMSKEEEIRENEEEDITEADLDRLAEVLASEEKEYLPYDSEEREEEEEE